jgi:hypothetical protein
LHRVLLVPPSRSRDIRSRRDGCHRSFSIRLSPRATSRHCRLPSSADRTSTPAICAKG